MKASLLSLLALSSSVSAWLPASRDMFGEQPGSVASTLSIGQGRSMKRFSSGFNKMRGVNLGSLFVVEPWMAGKEWKAMGCEDTKSEFDCMMKLGQVNGNAAFQKHWDTWITEADMDLIKAYGLNTIRVPVGYWMVESIVDAGSEHFPQGGLTYLDRLAGWAAKRNIYVILDLHAAPAAQNAKQPFTGQFAPTAGFYASTQFDRAVSFLSIMTTRIHSNPAYATTGMIEVLNEPDRDKPHPELVSSYYASAYKAVRDAEAKLPTPLAGGKQLTVQFMDKSWGVGNPRDVLKTATDVAFDDHRYLKWAGVETSKAAYLRASCADATALAKAAADAGNAPLVVGEWSLSPASGVEGSPEWNPNTPANKAFYTQWWAAQVHAYETAGAGWAFWSWKSELGDDYRWSYKQAVEASVVPKDPGAAAQLAKC